MRGGKLFDKLGINIIGPIQGLVNRKKYIVIATDYTTKYAEAMTIKNKTTVEVACFLTNK
ncbi:hypothetical protein PAEPH01_2682, partial [Pancytospora epiphaga]